MNTEKITRQTNLDVLRILSMLLIILFHSIIHGGISEVMTINGGIVHLAEYFLYSITQVCVNIYVLISGYFLVKSDFKFQKLIKLWMEVVFYSLFQRVLFIVFGIKPFSITSIVSCFIPVITGRYWFVTIYFGMYMLFPFINILIKAINKTQHAALNFMLFLLLSVTITIEPKLNVFNTGGGWGIVWFIVLYLSGAWFSLYYSPNGKYLGKLIGWFGISVIIVILVYLSNIFTPIKRLVMNLFRYDSATSYISSLLLFTAFLNMKFEKIKNHKLVSYIAASTFGVYLIHDHADTSIWLWSKLNLSGYMGNISIVLYQIIAVIIIFAICIVIDIIRKSTIGKIENGRFVQTFSALLLKSWDRIIKVF